MWPLVSGNRPLRHKLWPHIFYSSTADEPFNCFHSPGRTSLRRSGSLSASATMPSASEQEPASGSTAQQLLTRFDDVAQAEANFFPRKRLRTEASDSEQDPLQKVCLALRKGSKKASATAASATSASAAAAAAAAVRDPSSLGAGAGVTNSSQSSDTAEWRLAADSAAQEHQSPARVADAALGAVSAAAADLPLPARRQRRVCFAEEGCLEPADSDSGALLPTPSVEPPSPAAQQAGSRASSPVLSHLQMSPSELRNLSCDMTWQPEAGELPPCAHRSF